MPNFHESFIFESFPISFLEKDSPATAVLAATIDESMRRAGVEGGCVTLKGSLNTFMRGQKKHFL